MQLLNARVVTGINSLYRFFLVVLVVSLSACSFGDETAGNNSNANASSTLPTSLAVPQNVQASGGQRRVSISWDAVPQALDYIVTLNAPNGITVSVNVVSTSHVFTQLMPENVTIALPLTDATEYRLSVVARAADVRSEASPEVTATTAFGEVQGLLYIGTGSDMLVRWNAANTAVSYDVFIGTSAGINPSDSSTFINSVTNIQPATSQVVFDQVFTGLDPNTVYFINVVSRNAEGATRSREIRTVVAPRNLTVTAGVQNIVLNWEQVANIENYRIIAGPAQGNTASTITTPGATVLVAVPGSPLPAFTAPPLPSGLLVGGTTSNLGVSFNAFSVTGVNQNPIAPGTRFAITLSSFDPDNITSLRAVDIQTVETSTVPVRRLNDTGVELCADFAFPNATHNNDVDCQADTNNTDPDNSAEFNAAQSRQDAFLGFDRLAPRTSAGNVDGIAGFNFSRLGRSGSVVSQQEIDRAAANSQPSPVRCIRDNITGLIWEAKSTDPALPQFGSANRYSWRDPNAMTNGGVEGAPEVACSGAATCDTQSYINLVNAFSESSGVVGLCGLNNWRLPRLGELESIVNYGAAAAPLVDMGFFPDTQTNRYWSRATNSASTAQAWTLDFGTGLAVPVNKTDATISVRLVSGN